MRSSNLSHETPLLRRRRPAKRWTWHARPAMQTSTCAREVSSVPRWSNWAGLGRARHCWTRRWRGHLAGRCRISTRWCLPAAARSRPAVGRQTSSGQLSGSGRRLTSTKSTDRRTSTPRAGSTTPACSSSPGNGRKPRPSSGRRCRSVRSSSPSLHAEALAQLGWLRVKQGRAGEAEQLIAGYEQHAAVVPVLAAIRAVQGQFEVAEWLVRRRLDLLQSNSLAAAELRGLLVELELEHGLSQEALTGAEEPGRSLRLGRPGRLGTEPLLAGRALAALATSVPHESSNRPG